MDQEHLADLLERPEVQERILSDYEGGFSLGVTLNPEKRTELAIRVRIEDEVEQAVQIPGQIVLEGEAIPIIVSPSFRPPRPLRD